MWFLGFGTFWQDLVRKWPGAMNFWLDLREYVNTCTGPNQGNYISLLLPLLSYHRPRLKMQTKPMYAPNLLVDPPLTQGYAR